MPALHPAVALPTDANRDAKLADHGPLNRQIFLKLRGDPRALHLTAAVRTLRGQRRVVGLIHVRRSRRTAVPPIGGAGLAARPARSRHHGVPREGRRLAIPRAPRRLEFAFQSVVFPPQPLSLRFRPPQVLAQPLDLPMLLLDDLLTVTRRVVRGRRHAIVMPDPRKEYKSKRVCTIPTR